MRDICVGLFGTCDNSKWREEFIECYENLHVTYFNPDAGDNWHPGLIEDENRHLLEDEIILFPVLAESLGLGSLGEIGFSVLNVIRNIERGSNQHLIVMIDDDCTAANATASEIDHSQRTRKLVKSKLIKVTHPNVIVVNNLNAMLIASQSLLRLDELRINIAG
jgi:hypothetical protein